MLDNLFSNEKAASVNHSQVVISSHDFHFLLHITVESQSITTTKES
ncbi:hypothetical protein HOF65_00985 [bacterium]|nr:hypothetical protein [bacterium]